MGLAEQVKLSLSIAAPLSNKYATTCTWWCWRIQQMVFFWEYCQDSVF